MRLAALADGEPHGVSTRHHHRPVVPAQRLQVLGEHLRRAGHAAVPQETVDAGVRRQSVAGAVEAAQLAPLAVEKRQRHLARRRIGQMVVDDHAVGRVLAGIEEECVVTAVGPRHAAARERCSRRFARS